MNTSARRDGTPDRRGGTKRAASPRKGAPRSEAPRTNTPRSEAPRKDASRRDPAARRDDPRKDASRKDAARKDTAARKDVARRDPAAGARKDAPPRRAAGTPRDDGAQTQQRKQRSPKPQRKQTASPVVSNAKPARRQNVVAQQEPPELPWGQGERLQKVLAKAGVASRRAAEEMITEGRVEVDGLVVRKQGLRINPETAIVRVDGIRVVVRDELVYLSLNKPVGWQSTMSDDLGRPCVGDLVAERVVAGQRLFHVGRLDADTEGLLLLTNDGDLAHRLMHPSFEVPKTYLATVLGEVDRSVARQLKAGVDLDDGPVKVDKFQVLELGEGRSLVKLVLHEGRKHIVRRVLESVGHPVTQLVRTDIGPVALGNQRPGTMRALTRGEVGELYKAVGL